VKLIKEAN